MSYPKVVDHVEEICDYMVAALNNPATFPPDDQPAFRFLAEKTDNPLEELFVEQKSLKVYVVPRSEAAEKIGRGGQSTEEWSVNLVISRLEDTTYTRQRLSLFERQLTVGIRRLVKLGDGYYWSGDNQDSKYDDELHREKNQFVSIREFIFSGVNC